MTMEAKYTPGPWHVIQMNHVDGDLWLAIGWTDNGRKIGPVCDIEKIATLRHLIAPATRQWANANLISAAPEMYEALKSIEWQIDPEDEHEYCPCCKSDFLAGHREWCLIGPALAKAEGRNAEG